MSILGSRLRDLVALVAVVSHGRLGPADVCRVSQPFLSVDLRKIEEALGGRVFGRACREALITRQGAIAIQGVSGRQRNGGGFDKGKSGADNRTVQSGSVP